MINEAFIEIDDSINLNIDNLNQLEQNRATPSILQNLTHYFVSINTCFKSNINTQILVIVI